MNNEGSTFSREHLDTFCKINIEAQKNKDSWIYQLIEKGWEIPQLQGCCFPLSLPPLPNATKFHEFLVFYLVEWKQDLNTINPETATVPIMD